MWFAEQERYWVRGALFELSGFYIHPPYLLNIVQQANGYRDYDFEALEEELIEEELAITDSDGRVLVKVPQPEGGGEYQAYRLHLPNIFSKGEEFETYEEEPVWYP